VKPLKVCLMIDRAFLGGGQKNVLALTERLDRARFETTVCSRHDGPLAEAVRAAGNTHFAVPFRKRYDRRILGRIRTFLREGGFDILHTHGGVAGFYGRRAARPARVPVVIHTFHGIHYLRCQNPALKAALIVLERRLSRNTDAVMCVSDSVRDLSLAYRLVPEDMLTVIKNGIDFDLAHPSESDDLRSLVLRLDLDSASPLIGTVARLDPVKGLPILLRAVPRILQRLPSARLVIVGSGPERARLDALARDLEVQGCVHFLGERTDAPAWMGRFDMFVLPSLQEALPYVILEAAALEKPVVASEVGGIRELVRTEETGLLVPPGDPEALAAAVIRLAEDRSLGEGLGKKLRAVLSQEYTLSRMVEQTQDLYLRIYQKKLGTGPKKKKLGTGPKKRPARYS
jgi:glycosyltransferase involved in cell wall biosynthesis